MEEKIEKLFSFFRKIKNEPFYTSIIGQIIQIYETCPESFKYILYNLNQLIFTNTSEAKLRIKHRLICASIISKLLAIYINRIRQIVENEGDLDLENFQLDTLEENEKVFSDFVEGVQESEKWEKLDLFKIIEKEEMLVSSEKGGIHEHAEECNESKIFDEYINMKQATMINIEEIFKDVKSDKLKTEAAFEVNKNKYEKKIEKIRKKQEEYSGSFTLLISNPFNLLYQICVDNLLNPEWELRHLSVLLLKELIHYPDFLGFTAQIVLTGNDISREERFMQIELQTRDRLKEYFKNPKAKATVLNRVIVLNLKLLCLDRFADYQSDESNIIVRLKSAETLARCYMTFTTPQQLELLKKIKRIFDRDASIGGKDLKFTWEVKHSFMTFINFITEYPEKQGNIYKFIQESMIRMLFTEQQIDEIVLTICKCFNKFIGQKFFTQKEIQRVNEQVWRIVKNLDDISVSTVSALQLLGSLFPFYNLNVCNSLLEIRKFFASKIPDVRKQFYRLLSLLYEKKFTSRDDNDRKLIESNITQFLQASVVEYDREIFSTLLALSPNIFTHIRREKKMFNVIEFVTEIVLREDYTDKVIEEKFKIFDGFGLDKNDYIYIYEIEKSHITVDKYVDKRIWKVAQIVAKGFQNNFDGFPEMVAGIEKYSKNSFRGKLFILHLMVVLVQFHKAEPLFSNYLKNVVDMMKLEFCLVEDGPINTIKAYSNTLLDSLISKSEDFATQMNALGISYKELKVVKDISKLHEFLCLFLQTCNPELKDTIELEISAIQNLIEHQRTLFKQIKVLATCFFVKKEGFSGETLNSIVAAIKQALEEDKYRFISLYGAETFYELSLSLRNKKAIYNKIISSTLTHIALKYEKKDMKISEDENGYNLKSEYMMGMKKYILKIGQAIPEWLESFKAHFVKDYEINDEENSSKQPSLFLLSGTIESVLQICDCKFLSEMLEKIETILYLEEKPENNKNRKFLYNILTKMFLKLCDDYCNKSDIYFSWYLSKLKISHKVFLEVLDKIGEESIFRIAGVCSLFVLEIVRLISREETKDIAMLCLSNIVVGVYMNSRSIMFNEELTAISEDGVEFVKNFKDASNFEYKINVKLKEDINLRNYQEEGIQWLGFLTKFNLNGALCDDMGLGKTLQIFVLLENSYAKVLEEGGKIRPSLIVVPTTLTEHWCFEYAKYFVSPLCKTKIVTGKENNPNLSIAKEENKPMIYVTSYQVVEKKTDLFLKGDFQFYILDEGHIIKNPKTNKFQAVKKIVGIHRFILTGTPIQNRLKQLWSLFDFLMPGYLYSKETFKCHYEKLFQVNLTTFKEDELLFTDEQKRILEKLHFKVMPFIMRRMKSEVLKELPEKIINDYYCQMTEVQEGLYGEFESDNHNITKGKNEDNILTSLSKMRKILNHPNLVGYNGTYQDSGKFIALNDLFEQLGFREEDSNLQNKAIIFSRSTSTIELLEKLFMKTLYPKIRYEKLTAAVKPSERFMVAQNFNGDNDIKVLLVTTSVGGEGLNLSSANTVIMFDHDYNPTVDMQAIDRAHRIGQKRVLNVYRLITKETLEERIMGIQKFKKNLAEAIVNIDNASIKNIEQSRLPDLLENIKDLEDKPQKKEKIKSSFYKSLMSEMEKDVIEEEEYDKQY